VPVLSRDLEDGGEVLQAWVREERAEPLAHQSVADVLVAVAVRAERRLRVVRVQCPEPVEADPVVELGDRAVECAAVGDVDP